MSLEALLKSSGTGGGLTPSRKRRSPGVMPGGFCGGWGGEARFRDGGGAKFSLAGAAGSFLLWVIWGRVASGATWRRGFFRRG